MNEVTETRIEKYLSITKKALDHIQMNRENADLAGQFLDIAKRYYDDALHYKSKGDLVTAFAAVNYAHGWIDAGVRARILIAPPDTEDFIMPVE